MIEKSYDIIILGGGPAGLTAGIYSSRMGLKTLILESKVLGGRAIEAQNIENFPGFPNGIKGSDLIEKMVVQLQNFGATIIYPDEVLDIILHKKKNIIITRKDEFESKILIIATGTQKKKLRVEGENKFLGRGVSYCPICDGAFFKEKIVAVIGSENEAFQDSLFMSNIAKKVFLIVQKKDVEIPRSILNKYKEKSNIEILKAKVISINGNSLVKSITVKSLETEEENNLLVEGVFIAMGGIPLTSLAKKIGIDVDNNGCIKVNRKQQTNINGIFSAGDCTCGGMQIITAAGEGTMAAIQAYKFLKTRKKT